MTDGRRSTQTRHHWRRAPAHWHANWCCQVHSTLLNVTNGSSHQHLLHHGTWAACPAWRQTASNWSSLLWHRNLYHGAWTTSPASWKTSSHGHRRLRHNGLRDVGGANSAPSLNHRHRRHRLSAARRRDMEHRALWLQVRPSRHCVSPVECMRTLNNSRACSRTSPTSHGTWQPHPYGICWHHHHGLMPSRHHHRLIHCRCAARPGLRLRRHGAPFACEGPEEERTRTDSQMREMGWKNSYPPLSRRGALIQATFSQKPRSTAKHHHHHHQLEKAAYDKIKKHRDLYNLLLGDIGFLPLVASTSGRLNADFIRLAYLRATEA